MSISWGKFSQVVYHSASSSRTRGVLVGTANSVAWETEGSVQDKDGRWLTIYRIMGGLKKPVIGGDICSTYGARIL